MSICDLFLGLSYLLMCPCYGLAWVRGERGAVQDVLGSPMGILHVVRSDCLYALLPDSHSCVLLACSGRVGVQDAGLLRS